MSSFGKGEWYRVAYVKNELSSNGFENIDIQVKELSSSVESPAAYAEFFDGMVMQLILKFWSEEERKKFGGTVKPALLKHLAEKYGEGKVIELTMTSILSTARKPIE